MASSMGLKRSLPDPFMPKPLFGPGARLPSSSLNVLISMVNMCRKDPEVRNKPQEFRLLFQLWSWRMCPEFGVGSRSNLNFCIVENYSVTEEHPPFTLIESNLCFLSGISNSWVCLVFGMSKVLLPKWEGFVMFFKLPLLHGLSELRREAGLAVSPH